MGVLSCARSIFSSRFCSYVSSWNSNRNFRYYFFLFKDIFESVYGRLRKVFVEVKQPSGNITLRNPTNAEMNEGKKNFLLGECTHQVNYDVAGFDWDIRKCHFCDHTITMV